MLPYRESKVVTGIIVTFFLVLVAYGVYEAKGVFFGPSLSILDEPAIVHQEVITVRGEARRIKTVYMNGNVIPVTEDGQFQETFLLAPGYNLIVLSAEDAGGRTTEKQIVVVYEPTASSTPRRPSVTPASTEPATTTPAEASSTPEL